MVQGRNSNLHTTVMTALLKNLYIHLKKDYNASMSNTNRIGFIGQGFICGNLANDFEKRGYDIVRYSLSEPHVQNKELIKECDIVFIAVPTPTTPAGFDYSIVESVVSLVGVGKIAVIKSTILPGTTEAIQAKYPDIHVFHSPEFLREKTAYFPTAWLLLFSDC